MVDGTEWAEFDGKLGELRRNGAQVGFLNVKLEEWATVRGWILTRRRRENHERRLAWYAHISLESRLPYFGLYGKDDFSELENSIFNFRGVNYEIFWLDEPERSSVHEEFFAD